MTKKDLEDYQKLEQDISALEKRIRNLQSMAARYEYGAVTGSNPEFPYQPMSFHVSGYNIRDDEKKRCRIKNLQIRLEKQKLKAESQKIEVEEFIIGIEDVTTRLIFTYLYVDGMTQAKVAKKLHMDQSRISRKVDAYLKVA